MKINKRSLPNKSVALGKKCQNNKRRATSIRNSRVVGCLRYGILGYGDLRGGTQN